MNGFMLVDLPMLLAALLAVVACGTPGTWLVLRREAMSGDAIAHAVLPGLVGGFIATGTRSVAAMLAGAACAGIAALLLSAWAGRRARAGAGAALGTIFTGAFALGVMLLETQGARQVDLDPECVLFGSLETIFVVPPPDRPLDAAAWLAGLPRPVWTLAAASVVAIGCSIAFSKELAANAFDRTAASIGGGGARWIDRALPALAAAAIVASFEAVGTVLAIALVACPALIAAPFARSAVHQLWLGLAFAAAISLAGCIACVAVPGVLGVRTAPGAAGAIAAMLAAAVPLSHLLRAAVAAQRRPGEVSRRPA